MTTGAAVYRGGNRWGLCTATAQGRAGPPALRRVCGQRYCRLLHSQALRSLVTLKTPGTPRAMISAMFLSATLSTTPFSTTLPFFTMM